MAKKPTVTPLTVMTMISVFKHAVLGLIILILGIALGFDIALVSGDASGWLFVYWMIFALLFTPLVVLSVVTGIIYTIGIFKVKPKLSWVTLLIYSILTFGSSIVILTTTFPIVLHDPFDMKLFIITVAGALVFIACTVLHVVTIVKLYKVGKSIQGLHNN